MKLVRAFFGVILIGSLMPSVEASPAYLPRGVGGGGAMASYSISPYSDLRFVGTDMGTLFRSTDRGKNWTPVNQAQVQFNSDLSLAGEVGFSSDAKTVFFADAGRDPKRSRDAGLSWSSISIALEPEERVRYWVGDPKNAKTILCATSEGLWASHDLGEHWSRIQHLAGAAIGTAWLSDGKRTRIFHATGSEIFLSEDGGKNFRSWFSAPGGIRAFAGGEDPQGLTLAYLDSDGKEACSKIGKSVSECGWVRIFRAHTGELPKPDFQKTNQEGGRFLRMADNDSRTIYVTGGDWPRQYGSRVWVSRDAGKTFSLRFQVYDWDRHPYRPWPKDKLDYSAIGLDVGWDDNAPFSFAVNRRHSSEVGESGHYFLHTTTDFGEHWKSPFTRFSDQGERAKGKHWSSTGLEVTSALRMKFHPKNPKLAYVSLADLGGYVTEDGGQSFRISKAKYNTNYDYAFDPEKPDRVYAASGDRHDFPINFQEPIQSHGGIFVSNDRGKTWKRLTPDGDHQNSEYDRQFLSVAYDPIHRVIYGGTEGGGIARSTDGGKTWSWINAGFDPGDRVVPQIEVDPKDGEVYALLTGNSPEFQNRDETGIYRLSPKPGSHWELLRTHVVRPKGVDDAIPLWQFPTAFAVDFSKAKRNVLWMTDMEMKGAWLATGVWKSEDSGQHWKRMLQFTHPTAITLAKGAIHVSGLNQTDGKWGNGGAWVSTDGGETWGKNKRLPLLANLFGFTPDPLSGPKKGFFLFFGGGIYYGPSR